MSQSIDKALASAVRAQQLSGLSPDEIQSEVANAVAMAVAARSAHAESTEADAVDRLNQTEADRIALRDFENGFEYAALPCYKDASGDEDAVPDLEAQWAWLNDRLRSYNSDSDWLRDQVKLQKHAFRENCGCVFSPVQISRWLKGDGPKPQGKPATPRNWEFFEWTLRQKIERAERYDAIYNALATMIRDYNEACEREDQQIRCYQLQQQGGPTKSQFEEYAKRLDALC